MGNGRASAIAVSLCLHGVALAFAWHYSLPGAGAGTPADAPCAADGFFLVEMPADPTPDMPPQIEPPAPIPQDPKCFASTR